MTEWMGSTFYPLLFESFLVTLRTRFRHEERVAPQPDPQHHGFIRRGIFRNGVVGYKQTMEERLGIQPFSKSSAFKLFLLITICLCLASPSWAQQLSFSQLGKEELPPLGQKTQAEKEEFPAFGEKIQSESDRGLTYGYKIQPEKEEFFTRGQKTLLLNVGSMVAVFIYGLAKWEYGQSRFRIDNEGWFERDTKYGGADKLGHFWSCYALSHLFSYTYRKWGYTDKEANLYGALTSLGANTFMEIADGFSPSQGFSYEDFLLNIAGCGIAYIWGKYPSLASKIDFRIEYKPEFNSRDFGFSTNYERQKFLIALKAEGFDFIKNPYLRYLEFHVGYYARGYKDYEEGGPDHRRRKLYVGIGFNVSRLVQKFVNTTVFNYIQIPYTSVDWTVTSDKN